jgi:hypothetical protein
MVPDELTDVPMDSQELQSENMPLETEMQGIDSVPAPLIVEPEEFDSTNSSTEELASDSFRPEDTTTQQQQQLQPLGSFPVLYPAYFSPFYPFPLWSAAYVTEPTKEETHEILRPTAVHSKAAPINVDQLLGMSQLSLGESSQNGVSEQEPLSLRLVGGSSSRQSAFHPNPASGGGGSDMTHAV